MIKLFEGDVFGGIMFTSKDRQGNETRYSKYAEIGENIDNLVRAFNATSVGAVLPSKAKETTAYGDLEGIID